MDIEAFQMKNYELMTKSNEKESGGKGLNKILVNEEFKCKTCGQKFKTRKIRGKHMKRYHEWLFKGKNIQNEKSDDNKTEDSVNKNEDINDVNADLNMTSEIEDITKVKTINKNNESTGTAGAGMELILVSPPCESTCVSGRFEELSTAGARMELIFLVSPPCESTCVSRGFEE